MDNICIDCRKNADCKRKPRTDQWTVAGCSLFEAYTIVTNADRIRQMTDEELAGYHTMVCGCPPGHDQTFCEKPTIECKGCWLRWLKSPVEVDNVRTD